MAPLVQVELPAMRPVAAFSLLSFAAPAIQSRPIGNLFPEFEKVRVWFVAAVIGALRMRLCGEDKDRFLPLLPATLERFQQRMWNRHAAFFVALGNKAKLRLRTNA